MLQEDVFLDDRNITGRIYLTGEHILQENMYYWRNCLNGGHALLEYMSYWRKFFMKYSFIHSSIFEFV